MNAKQWYQRRVAITAGCGSVRSDVVFVVDSSATICPNSGGIACNNWNTILRFINNIIDRWNIDNRLVQVGLVTYGSSAQSQFYLNRYLTKSSLQAAVLNTPYSGGVSNLASGLSEARTNQFTSNNGDRPGVQNIVIFITDGFDQSDSINNALNEASLLKASGVVIYGVGFDRANQNEDTFRSIASLPQQLQPTYYQVSTIDMLNTNVIDPLVARICVSSASSDCSPKVMDIIFVLDSSSNVGSSGWSAELNFVSQIVNALTIGSSATRVGVVSFSNIADFSIRLYSYTDKSQLTNAILSLQYQNSGTVDIFSALSTARTGFNDQPRTDVPRVVVFLTGSASTVNQNLVAAEVRRMRRDGITVYAIGVTSRVNQTELMLISNHPHLLSQQMWNVSDFGSSLTNIANSVIGALCKPVLDFFCRLTELGGYQCFCPLDECDIVPVNGTQCQDVDECQNNYGGCSQICNNNVGSYVCSCMTGFFLSKDMRSCQDVNECDQKPCTPDRTCVNSWGTYYCISNTALQPSALSGDPASAAASDKVNGLDRSATIGLASALSALVAALSVVGIVLAIRFYRNRHQDAMMNNLVYPTRSTIFTPSASSLSTVSSRYSLPQSALDDEDSVSNTQ